MDRGLTIEDWRFVATTLFRVVAQARIEAMEDNESEVIAFTESMRVAWYRAAQLFALEHEDLSIAVLAAQLKPLLRDDEDVVVAFIKERIASSLRSNITSSIV